MLTTRPQPVSAPLQFLIADPSPRALVPVPQATAIACDTIAGAARPTNRVGAVGLIMGPAGAFAAMFATAFAYTGNPVAGLTSLGIVAAGAVATGLRGLVQSKRAERDGRLLTRDFASEIAALEHDAANVTGFQRAWIAVCADGLLSRIHVSGSAAKRLTAIAALRKTPRGEDLANAQHAYALYRSAMPLVGTPDVCNRLEDFNIQVMNLPAEARAVLKGLVADGVVQQLDAQPGNKWRRQRFLDAFEGVRTPYAERLPSIDAPEGARWGAPYANSGDAVSYAAQKLHGPATSCRLVVTADKVAEAVGAYMEWLGYSAMLHGQPDGTVAVLVYDNAYWPSRDFA